MPVFCYSVSMYVKRVAVKKSNIDGRGVFAAEDIANGEIVWIFEPLYDKSLSLADYDLLGQSERDEVHHSGYLSPVTNTWIVPPANDPACYTNHSDRNNMTARYDIDVSPEPIFIANRTISKGEELTNNYYEFDQVLKDTKPNWLS